MEDEEMVTQTENEVDETTQTDEQSQEETNVEDQRWLDQKRRAEKAEAELKALKEQKEQTTKKTAKSEETQKTVISNQDETFLIAVLTSKGLSFTEIDTYLEKARKIAVIEEIPLKSVLDNDLFKSFDAQFQRDQKSEEAAMGASKGSGGGSTKKTLQTPGLSDDEFKALLRKQVIG